MNLIVKTTTLFLLGCTLICSTESTASAQDAERVFNRCVERIHQITERVTNAQRETLRECLPRIKRLLDMGEIEEARYVARRCIGKLDSLTEAGIGALRETCRPCLERLRELKAYRLAERLSRICEESAQQLNQQNRRARNAIVDLF
jgi:hypothetical protein